MKKRLVIYALGLWMVGVSSGRAQEEKSAEVFLEAYSDKFQDLFFEALRQKGIENYDRAEALLLECKQIEPLKPVLDHELAKVLMQRKQFASAEAYAIAAVRATPAEYWYMPTLMDILSAQYKDEASLSGILPLDMPEIRRNLAKWYLGKGSGDKALEYLKGSGEDMEARALREKARNLVGGGEKPSETVIDSSPAEEVEEDTPGELTSYRNELERLLESQSWEEARTLGREAVESYPLQPEFYLGIGKALIGLGEYQQALETLEEAEFLILEPGPVALRLFEAIAEAYTALGNPEKAQEYLNKAKAVSQ